MPGPVVVDETSQDCHYPKRTAPAVDVYDYNGYDFDAIIQSIIVAGGCVVKNILNRDEVTAVEGEVRPYLDADKDWEGGFFPKETHRCHGMVGKSPTYTMKIIGNDLYQKVAEYFLTSKYTAWNGNRRDTMVSKPQLNCTNVFSIGPGARDQELHRDDMIHHNFALEQAITPEQYKVGRDVGLGLFVAGKKTTKQNGATRFIPGSHLWALEEPPVEELAFYAELEPGDGMLMLSSCFHGGSANHTEDEERLVYGAFVTRGYLRQVRTFL